MKKETKEYIEVKVLDGWCGFIALISGIMSFLSWWGFAQLLDYNDLDRVSLILWIFGLLLGAVTIINIILAFEGKKEKIYIKKEIEE